MRHGALNDVAALAPQQIWEGVSGRVVSGERITLGLLELAPGSRVPEHQHEHEQTGLVITGSLTFTVGAETRALGPGGTWSIPGNTPHSVETGPDGAVVVDVFAPVREDWDGLPPAPPAPPRWPG